MKFLKKILIVIAVTSFSQFIYANCELSDVTLNGLVGLDSSSGKIFANINTTTPNACSCSSYARWNPVNTDTKMILSILLSAKMANKKVRIDLLNGNDCDSAYRVYLQ